MPDLEHHLLCPMQCRADGTITNECPQMYDANISEESHLILLSDENGRRVVLPFFFKGVLVGTQ